MAAAALQIYTLCTVYVNGALLAEEQTVKLARKNNDQEVLTVCKGFAGMSPGAESLEISVENGVPSSDFEVNPGPFMKRREVVEVTLFAAGRTLTSKGFFTDDSFNHGVNTQSKLDFTFKGQWADWT